MTAIRTNRLRADMAQLMALQRQPAQFVYKLHQMLDFYNDYSYRPGQASQIQSLLPHYKIPLPVTRQIEYELTCLCNEDALSALLLADTLWQESYFEARLLAIHILSQVAVTPPEPVLERLSAWAQPDEDKQVLKILITHGAERLLREKPDQWSDLTHSWLINQDRAVQAMGLQALYATVEDDQFQNLPAIFRLISPHVQTIPNDLLNDLIPVLQALAKRSPGETAYFFHQVLTIATNDQIPHLIRRCLQYLSPETQESLRAALRPFKT